jgi:hypothetical protein
VARFVLPFLPKVRDRWFCSEACGEALGLDNAHRLSPADLLELLQPRPLEPDTVEA